MPVDSLAKNLDLLGAITAVLFYLSAILVFAFRLGGKPQAGYWLGIFELCLSLPMVYLLLKAPSIHRPALYYIQIGLLLLWLLVELLLDYILKFDFRQIRWIVIGYVTLFFAGSGGMLGVAARAGRGWTISSIILFIIMAVLTFVQRKSTGM